MGKNQDEYNSLCSQRDQKQREINACNDRIEDYDYLLGRLRNAKNSVSDLKEDFNGIKKNEEKLIGATREWVGEQYNTFVNNKGANVNGMNSYYYNYGIDHVLDSLNNEITRIENLRMEQYGLLGKLGQAFNNLCNKIENFFN